MIFLGIVVSIVMFSIIVLIHEYGHYKTARMFNIHVDEFGLGIPPRAKKLWKNKSGTLFSLNWIPLGGFVKIAGESEIFLEYYGKKGKILSHAGLIKKIRKHEDIFDKKGEKIHKGERKYILARCENQRSGKNFYEKNILVKSLVLLAGVIMNFVLAWAIFSFLFFIGVKPLGVNSIIETDLPSKLIPTLEHSLEKGFIKQGEGVLLYPIDNSLAEISGIRHNDILLRIDDQDFDDILDMQAYISSKPAQEISLYIERKTRCDPNDEEKIKCPIIEYMNIFVTPNNDGLIGTYLSPNYIIYQDFIYKYSLLGSIKHGFLETYYQARLTLSGLKLLSANIFFPKQPEDRKKALDQVAGPIGIVDVITRSLQGGIILLLALGAIISVNLGVFNLLPIPALDGGRLLLLWVRSTIDKVLGKSALSGNIENSIHFLFFLVLIALSIFIAYNDINKLL